MPLKSLNLKNIAILVDVDGTLLDIAPTPQEVRAPASLKATLANLLDLTGGALALVSGRPIADLDRILNPLRLPAIGGHGAETRPSPLGPVDRSRSAPLDPMIKRDFASIAEGREGVFVEDKGYSLALHFRLAPGSEAAIRSDVDEMAARHGSKTLEILPGKSVIEIKQAAFNKGTAVRDLMHHPPFRGRRPLFLGDDVTDESVFRVLPEYDGIGFSVGDRLPEFAGRFGTPGDVRRWLSRMAERKMVPEL